MERSIPACATCSLRGLCLPEGLAPDDVPRLDEIKLACRDVPKGEMLFRAGDRFEAVFAVQAGSFKTRRPLPAGGEQINHFHMAGDLLGWTGIALGVLACDAVALEDSQVCVIDFQRLETLSRACPALQRRLNRSMSESLIHSQAMLALLAQGSAGQRVAAFLIELADRHQRLGLPADELSLRMSREEIANLLGLRIETVSRCLSRLQLDGTLSVRGRQVRIRSRETLQRRAHAPGADDC